MSKIIAVGGGEIRTKETLIIDRKIVRFSGKTNPKVLFIPTASGDAEGYIETVMEIFTLLGCSVEALCLAKEAPSFDELEKQILAADIIYVGGGNTLKMMNRWNELGLPHLLKNALDQGTVLSGLSAGAICWFRYGNSDSLKFESGTNELMKVEGLGFVDALFCPHYDVEVHRQEDLKQMMKENTDLVAIACENGSAIQIWGEKYRIISSINGVKAYKVYWKMEEYIKEEIEEVKEWRELKDLLKK